MIISGATIQGFSVYDATVNTSSSLLLSLDANNTNSYSGSGTTLSDLSGNGYTHTLTNSTYTVLNNVKCLK